MHVLHCPGSNLKLGSGIAPVAELRTRGVSVSLGADGAACNNRLDMFDEMRACAGLQAVRRGPGALPARDVVAMATRDGARAIGFDPGPPARIPARERRAVLDARVCGTRDRRPPDDGGRRGPDGRGTPHADGLKRDCRSRGRRSFSARTTGRNLGTRPRAHGPRHSARSSRQLSNFQLPKPIFDRLRPKLPTPNSQFPIPKLQT